MALATIRPIILLLLFRGFVGLVCCIAGEVLVICRRLGVEFFQHFSLLGNRVEVYLWLVEANCKYSVVHVVALKQLLNFCLFIDSLSS